MTWKEISRENLVAAKSLALDARWRSAVSRAYYAAHAAVAGELKGLATYPKGRLGPSHDLMPQITSLQWSSSLKKPGPRYVTQV